MPPLSLSNIPIAAEADKNKADLIEVITATGIHVILQLNEGEVENDS